MRKVASAPVVAATRASDQAGIAQALGKRHVGEQGAMAGGQLGHRDHQRC